MKKVLITGGAGFIGSNLGLRLCELGYKVTVIDNLSQQVHGLHSNLRSPLYLSISDKVRFIHGSVDSRNDLMKAIDDNEIVVHLAAETGTGQSMYQIEKYSRINMHGTALLLDILANTKHRVRKVVIASSRAVYGEGKYKSEELGMVYPLHRNQEDMDRGDFEVKYPFCNTPLISMPTDERSVLHPSSVYGITKLTQEQMAMTVCKSLNIPSVAFRYQNVYGPGQSLSNPYTGILSIFSVQIKNGNPVNIFEDGKESRDFVFVDDAVDATIAGIEREQANYEIFNVGSGVPVDVYTVAKTLQKHFNTEACITITGNYRLGDIRHNFADLTKVNKLLGFFPKVDFDTGIRKFVDWVKAQEVWGSQYAASIEEMKTKGLYR